MLSIEKMRTQSLSRSPLCSQSHTRIPAPDTRPPTGTHALTSTCNSQTRPRSSHTYTCTPTRTRLQTRPRAWHTHTLAHAPSGAGGGGGLVPSGPAPPNPPHRTAKLDYTWGARGHTQDSGGCAGGGETERPRRDRQPQTTLFSRTASRWLTASSGLRVKDRPRLTRAER